MFFLKVVSQYILKEELHSPKCDYSWLDQWKYLEEMQSLSFIILLLIVILRYIDFFNFQ
jgi:hypothetical protein